MQQLCKASAEKRLFLDDTKVAVKYYLVKMKRLTMFYTAICIIP